MSANTHPALPEPQYRSANTDMFTGQKGFSGKGVCWKKSIYRHSGYFKLISTLETAYRPVMEKQPHSLDTSKTPQR